MVFFFRKMISLETWYKTNNQMFLAIIGAFKIKRYYFEGCKYEVFVFIDQKNICYFIKIKSLSSKQVNWPRSFLLTISTLITTKEKLIPLLILFFNFYTEVQLRKTLSEIRISRFFIVCNIC